MEELLSDMGLFLNFLWVQITNGFNAIFSTTFGTIFIVLAIFGLLIYVIIDIINMRS